MPVGQVVRTSYSLDTVAVFGALLTTAAAAAFRQGARLREDADKMRVTKRQGKGSLIGIGQPRPLRGARPARVVGPRCARAGAWG
ncbi:hypothetical protein D7231_17195 [Streptomyces klenkii]|uniref:Uncharacterized protein n=1 Tax=Streptomyces klenkii TaxID=1420899 RepID=A0A3B0BG69_9ACTN|nr:hypothetical protein D7231_17195 [Streptomyces klenkii]